MKLTQILSALTLAFGLVGGAIVLTPSASEASSRKGDHISYEGLKKSNPSCRYDNCRPGGGKPHNPWQRGCNAINRCRG